ILYAVAAKKILAHAHDPLSLSGRFCLSAGIGLFLLGFVLGSRRVGGLVMYERLLAISLIAALSAVPLAIPGLGLAALVLFVLACALALEHRRRKRHPAH
ncbi:MAG TPA: hypothetical protein PK472_01730, partial [Pseudomonadota bacterium]|nr:hypothetical protein [Pseudomonadota bacterium]